VNGGIQVGDGGTISLPDTPGLGASIDAAYLDPALAITLA
jgi:L-alanine-DL-glutamate epimerase-like enolase superfamily enzyme